MESQKTEKPLPVRSEGTRYFLLSRSGTLALGAFSTMTWKENRRGDENRRPYCPSFHTLNLSTLSRLSVTFQSLLPMFLDFTQLQITYKEQEKDIYLMAFY